MAAPITPTRISLKVTWVILGNIRLADITNLMVQSHLLSLRNLATGEKLSPKMLINVRNFISLVFNYAIQNRILNYNPVQGVKLPKQSKRISSFPN